MKKVVLLLTVFLMLTAGIAFAEDPHHVAQPGAQQGAQPGPTTAPSTSQQMMGGGMMGGGMMCPCPQMGGMGMGMGPGMMQPGMMGGMGGMQPGMGMGMMGGGMGMMGGGMGRMMNPMGMLMMDPTNPAVKQQLSDPEMKAYLDETKDARRELVLKRFEYFETARNPMAKPEDLTKIRQEIRKLQAEIYSKAPLSPFE